MSEWRLGIRRVGLIVIAWFGVAFPAVGDGVWMK